MPWWRRRTRTRLTNILPVGDTHSKFVLLGQALMPSFYQRKALPGTLSKVLFAKMLRSFEDSSLSNPSVVVIARVFQNLPQDKPSSRAVRVVCLLAPRG